MERERLGTQVWERKLDFKSMLYQDLFVNPYIVCVCVNVDPLAHSAEKVDIYSVHIKLNRVPYSLTPGAGGKAQKCGKSSL